MNGPGGEITSPNYPNPYPSDVECTWMIRVRNEERILINVLELDLGKSGMAFSHTSGSKDKDILVYMAFKLNSSANQL